MPEPARVAMFLGEDQYVLRQAALALLERHGVRPTEVDGAEWQGGETSDLATPSLWGERRALLVTNCQALPDAGARELRAYVESPAPDAVCVMTMVTKAKSPPPLAKAVQQAGGSVTHAIIKRQDLAGWVVERAKAREVRLAQPGAAALVEVVGDDPATLDRAVEQLGAAFGGASVGPDQVRAQFRGLGDQKVWDLCDQAFAGRLGAALVTLRGLLAGRDDPLVILGGIASRVRDLLRVRDLPERMPAAEAAKQAGLRFDWQVRRYREQAGRFTAQELAALHGRVVETDRALKGGVQADVVLSMLVAAMSGRTDVGLDQPVRVSR